MALTSSEVLASLDGVSSPDGLPLPKTGVLSDILVADGKVFFSITVNAAVVQAWEPVRKRAEAAVKAIPGVTSVMVALTAERKAGAAAPPPQQRPAAPPQGRHAGPGAARAQGPTSVEGVGAIIAVASGKGGVGKSTTAVNLALGLRDLGLRVGVLDADIYGPSMPKLLGIKGRPQTRGGTTLIPMDGYGLKVMSIGFLIEEETPMIWRGPMVMSALTQMLREVDWGELDIMVVDMPPGTGDAQLTMAQQVPLKGAVIVSTPQDLALIDARRGICHVQPGQRPGARHRREHELFPVPGMRDALGHFRPWRRAPRGRAPRRAVPRRGAAAHGDPGEIRRRPAGGCDRAGRSARPDLSRHRRRGCATRWRAGPARPRPKIVIEA